MVRARAAEWWGDYRGDDGSCGFQVRRRGSLGRRGCCYADLLICSYLPLMKVYSRIRHPPSALLFSAKVERKTSSYMHTNGSCDLIDDGTLIQTCKE